MSLPEAWHLTFVAGVTYNIEVTSCQQLQSFLTSMR